MSREKDIKASDLNKALWRMSRKARRENKALGLETLYGKDGYLVKCDASGKEHRIKKMERRRTTIPPHVINFD